MPRLNDGALAPVLHVILVMAICAEPGLSQARRSVPVGRASMDVSLLDADTTTTVDMERRGPLPVANFESDFGSTARDLLGRALGSNSELAARRRDIDCARALIRQAGPRPNPAIEFEHGSGRIVDNPGERETTVGGMDVECAYAGCEAARRAVDIVEQNVLVQSSSNVATIREAYQLGVYRVTGLTAEQRRSADVDRDYTAALAEARQAHADLQAAVGAAPFDTGLQAKDENNDR